MVSLNRGHRFTSMDQVQAELSSLVLPLTPQALRQKASAIPFTTTDYGMGARRIIEEVTSPLSG